MTAAFPSGKCLKCVLIVGKTGIKKENKVILALSGMWKSFWAGSEYTSIVQQQKTQKEFSLCLQCIANKFH